jgi:hypothetical protein
MTQALEDDEVTTTRRGLYLQLVPMTLVPLKDKAFKVEAVKEEKVDGKPAAALKVTGPDGKDFTLYLDKQSGLPVKTVAKVPGFMGGGEVTQETTYSDYKEMDGIKRATRTKVKRDGEKFLEQEISDFRILDKVDPKMFAEPK